MQRCCMTQAFANSLIICYRIVQNVRGTKLLRYSRFTLNCECFSANFKLFRRLEIFNTSFWAILMQTWKFFSEYSHGDLTAKVLSLETFILYGKFLCVNRQNFVHIVQYNMIALLEYFYLLCSFAFSCLLYSSHLPLKILALTILFNRISQQKLMIIKQILDHQIKTCKIDPIIICESFHKPSIDYAYYLVDLKLESNVSMSVIRVTCNKRCNVAFKQYRI